MQKFSNFPDMQSFYKQRMPVWMKDFDTFSFKAKNRSDVVSEISQKEIQEPPKRWNQLKYRFQQQINPPPPATNKKIMNIEKDLEDNIRRRIEIEQKLHGIQNQEKSLQLSKFMKEQNVQTDNEQIQNYIKLQQKTHKVQQMIERPSKLQRMKLTSEKSKRVPNQAKIISLFKRVTFPELPTQSLQKLAKQCGYYYSECQHSDLNYLMMCINFHRGKYNKVRQHYKEIVSYKLFQRKAHWVAAETEFECLNYELCIRLAEKCMKELGQDCLPRFTYLQARSYHEVGNFINSIVCYNQLIKMKPKIAQYYLERGIIYGKIGYLKQAQEDYLIFGITKPQASSYLKEKILAEEDQFKRKQLIQALRNIN